MSHPNSVNKYDIGDLIRAVASFAGTDGVTPATPSMVSLLHKNPLGSVSTWVMGVAGASIIQVGSAAYARDFTAEAAGSGFYRWEGTGLTQAVEEWGYIVSPSFVL